MGLSLIPFLAAPAAQAAGTITGTVSPVRFTGTAGSFETTVPAAAIAWPIADSNVFSGSPSIYFDGTTAASPSLNVYDAAGTSVVSTISVLDDTPIVASNMGASGDDSFIRIKVNAAGTYTGKIANGSDTVSWSFSTTGAASSIVLTPATQSTLVGGTADLTAALLDSTGKPTQPTNVSQVNLATSGAGGTLSASSLSVSALALGSADFTVSSMASGSTTVTATGAGDLLTQSATAAITASGSVSDDTVAGMSVTSPTTGVWNGTAWPSAVAQVKAGTSSVTVTVDDTTANAAGETIRLAAWVSAGTVNGQAANSSSAPIYVDVTTDANKQATATFTLGAGALLTGETLTVQQANVTNVLKTNIDITVEQVTPAVTNSTVSISPSGSNVRKLGDTTTVVVTADDSLGDPVAGLQVLAYRGSASAANLISSGTTGADGSASVTVTSASTAVAGTTESYVFSVATVGTLSSPNTLSIEYSADGKIDTLSVAPGSASTFDAAGSATVTTYPVISVPTTTGLVGTSNSTGINTISTGATSGTVSPLLAVVVTPSPANSATVTVPEGVKVSATAPDAETLWSAGSQEATVASGGTAYIWSTKTGTHTYTVESGGLTATGTLIVGNSVNDAYDIGISPVKATVDTGSISTVELSLKDMFGNPVEAAGTTSGDDTGAIKVTASGGVLLAGFATTNTFATDANGKATVTVIAGNAAGTGLITATPGNTVTPAWQTTYSPPTGKSAPTLSAVSEYAVTAPESKSISIVGSRTTVKGKPGISIVGVTQGIEDGKTVLPYFRFPGQTTYTEGSARPEITDGEFVWERKTGKKFYAYVTSDDGVVKSNRVIIPAK